MSQPARPTRPATRYLAGGLAVCGLMSLVASFLPWASEARWGRPMPLWGQQWGGQKTALIGVFVLVCAYTLLRAVGRLPRALIGIALLMAGGATLRMVLIGLRQLLHALRG